MQLLQSSECRSHSTLMLPSSCTLSFKSALLSHFNRTVAKRSVFHSFVNTQAELIIWTQNATFRYDTVEVENRLYLALMMIRAYGSKALQ